MKILIVDDRPTNLKLLRAVLEAEGTTVCEAADGFEALAVLQHERVDAVISDILMPRMDGYRLCMELRANHRFCDLPFIAYTATYTSDRDEKLMTNIGADRFLRKPASATVLTSTLADVVKSKRLSPPTPVRARHEVGLMTEYTERLAAKLEDRNLAREATTEQQAAVEDNGVATPVEREASTAQREQWLKLVATSTAAVFMVENDCIAFANAEAARITGVGAPDDLIGRNLFDFLPRDPRLSHSDRTYADADRQDNPRPVFEQTLQRPNGTVVEIETTAAHFQFHGRPGTRVEVRDIGKSKGAKSRLAVQHAVTAVLSEMVSFSEIGQKILAALGAGMGWDCGELWMVERGTHVLRCTETWHVPSTGFPAFAAQSKGLTFASGQGLAGRVWASGRSAWNGDVLRSMGCPRGGQAPPLGLRTWIGFPLKLRGEVAGVVGFFAARMTPPDAEVLAFLDMIGLQMGQFIERQQLADLLRRSQRMEAVGTLASGIAHDFNNILGGIYGYCELARMEAGCDGPIMPHLDAIMDGARRATDLVHQILGFSQQQDQERRPIQLRHITLEALRLLRAAVPATVKFQLSVGNAAPLVLANATQIHQILMNLGTNAAHAMRERGGCLTVKLEDCQMDAELAARAELRVGRHACLTVSDTGHGMSPETLARIYEPLFTTKPPGEGTGLGLAVVRGIVRAHEGSILASSCPGEGTTFRIYFPAHLAAAKEVVCVSTAVPRGAGERILFVDDEASLADVGKLLLNHLGYVTDTCANAHEAIERVSAHPAAYALVITDLMMPGVTGVDLAQRLNAIRPDLPIVLTSGSAAAWPPERLRAAGIRRMLAKPLSAQGLAVAVHEIISQAIPRAPADGNESKPAMTPSAS